MSIVNLPNNWQPRWYQKNLWDFLSSGGKRASVIAHRRWGKDDVFLHHAACAAHERIGNYGHCLPEYAQGKKAIWTAVNPHTGRRRIDEAFPPEIRENTNDQEMFIRLKSGSTFQVLGSDQYNRWVGTAYAGLTFSEWALANPAAWGYAQPILNENNGWAAFITTPRGRNHAKRMHDMAERHPDWYAEISDILKTKALGAAEIEDARQELISIYGEDVGNSQFEQEYLCSFTAQIVGSYYGREISQLEAEGRIRSVVYDEIAPVQTAWDLGYSDDTAIWFYQVISGEIRIIDFYSASGRDIDHYAEYIKSKPYKYDIHWLPHDAKAKTLASNGKSIQEQFAAHFGWGALRIVPNLSLEDGIQAARKMFPNVYFDHGCEDGIEALRQYAREWDDDGKCFRQRPKHDWTSHAADAFRYLAIACRESYKPPEKPKETITTRMPTFNELMKEMERKRLDT